MNPVDPAVNAPSDAAPDGRRDRWAGHRRQRREELIDAAIDAIRAHGPDVGIDVIAAHAGISKPVLYRYFADKSQLWLAIGQRTAALVVDAITPAVAAVREDRAVIAVAVDAYLATIESDPHLYRFVMHKPDIPRDRDVVGDAVDTVAGGLARVVGDRLRALGLDSGPAQPWSYGMVGFVQAAGDWWLRDRQPISRAALTEYLTALLWGGIAGIRAAADLPGGIAAITAAAP
jgi:AcrR family transcriptional regulator